MPLPIPLIRLAARGRRAGLLLTTLLLLGADDDYLREIDQEARRQATSLLTDQALPEPGPGPTTVTVDTADRLQAGLDQAGFEEALHENLPGTYAFYQRLAPANRLKVHAAYQKDNRLTSISEQIVRLASGKP